MKPDLPPPLGLPQPHASARRNVGVLFLVPGAAVVALALVLLRLHMQPPTVPPYVTKHRDDMGFFVIPGSRFDLPARPTEPVVGAVGVRGFLVHGDEVRPWDPHATVGAEGEVRVVGTAEELFAGVPDGAWDAVLAIGRPETLPARPSDVLERLRAAPPDRTGWQLVHMPVYVRLAWPEDAGPG